MPTQVKKRIYNPNTRRYYVIRQKTTEKGYEGQIKGIWNPKKRRYTKSK